MALRKWQERFGSFSSLEDRGEFATRRIDFHFYEDGDFFSIFVIPSVIKLVLVNWAI